MQRFREWFDDYPKLEVLPWERKGKGRFGNELQDTATGGKILGTPFKNSKGDFERKIDLPTPSTRPKEGLGELGMREVSKSTFKPSSIPAGEIPTLSRGIPVESVVAQATDNYQRKISEFPPQLQQAMQYLKTKTPTQINNATGEIKDVALNMIGAKGGLGKIMQTARQWKKDTSMLPISVKNQFSQPSQLNQSQPGAPNSPFGTSG